MAIVLLKTLKRLDAIAEATPNTTSRKFEKSLHRAFDVLIVVITAALVLLACMGYMMTAVVLSLVDLATMGIIAGGFISYHLALRWFMIKERRLALAAALEERRSRKEARNSEQAAPEEFVDVDEPEIELDAIGQQTRRLLRSLSLVGVVVTVWIVWARTLPFDQTLDGFTLFADISLLKFIRAALVHRHVYCPDSQHSRIA